MDNSTKFRIKEQLAKYVADKGSQNRAAKDLTNVSIATISNILSEKWNSISDDLWRSIDRQTGGNADGWQFAETLQTKLLHGLYDDARNHHNVYAIVAEAGSGKSKSAKMYAAENVFLVACNEYFNRRSFLQELLKSMGRDGSGANVAEMMQIIINHILRCENPVIILDEADKLSDQVLYFFITLYNHLEDRCGIVLMATGNLEKRIERGLRLGKRGYSEIFSRIGRKFISIKPVGRRDVEAVCRANGVSDTDTITAVFNESEGDLRRVKRLVHKNLMQNVKAS